MKNILSPSILSADFCKLGQQIKELEESGVTYLHFDVMDGVFVPSISFGMPVLKSVRKGTELFLDVHLMITEPERYIEEFAKAGADLINFHLEATANPGAVIEQIRSTGKRVGITIKPNTPVEAVYPYLELVDMVLIMTVEPGFGGQALIVECLDKVKTLRQECQKRKITMDIEVDGGMKADNVHLALEAGANVIVAGSAVFGDGIREKVNSFMECLK